MPLPPAARFLALISHRRQIRRGFARRVVGTRARWVWRWKDWIDRRFMRQFNELPEMDEPSGGRPRRRAARRQDAMKDISAIAMRCGGCGAKVGATVLTRALARIEPAQRGDVLIGLDAPGRRRRGRVPPGKAVGADGRLFPRHRRRPLPVRQDRRQPCARRHLRHGRRAADRRSPSRPCPMGSRPRSRTRCRQMMTGANEILREAGCALVGGHTERRRGARARLRRQRPGRARPGCMRKGGLRPGRRADPDQADRHRHAARRRHARQGQGPLDRWPRSPHMCSRTARRPRSCLRDTAHSACTDVTGFGLLGHLVEMVRASDVDVTLDLGARAAAGRRRGDACAPGILSARCSRRTCGCAAPSPTWRRRPRSALSAALRPADGRRAAGRRAGGPGRCVRRTPESTRLCAGRGHRQRVGEERAARADHDSRLRLNKRRRHVARSRAGRNSGRRFRHCAASRLRKTGSVSALRSMAASASVSSAGK